MEEQEGEGGGGEGGGGEGGRGGGLYVLFVSLNLPLYLNSDSSQHQYVVQVLQDSRLDASPGNCFLQPKSSFNNIHSATVNIQLQFVNTSTTLSLPCSLF